MDAVEKAIRSALERGNADERSFREVVYRKAFAALERAIEGNPNMTPDLAAKRRAGVQAMITDIESDYIPAVHAAPRVQAVDSAGQPPRVDPGPPDRAEPGPVPQAGQQRTEPALDISTGQAAAAPIPSVTIGATGPVPQAFFPNLDDFGTASGAAGDEEAVVTTDGGPNVSTERRRPFAALFLIATLAAAVCVGGWWAYSTGLFKSAAEIDTSVPNPPAETEGEDFLPEEENNAPLMPGSADADRNWIAVFAPADPTSVNAPSGTTAEVMQDDSGDFIRIRSGSAGSAILFDIGQGTLEQIAGKHAVFDIIARAEEGNDTQFAVDCNFGELGDCGRKRYAAGPSKGDFLFEIDMPAGRPGSSGTIAVNSDITNGGKALDIYEIRVSTVE